MIIASDLLEKKPLVSIIVPTYNQQYTIAQTIESILNQQSEFPIEIIIGDDCSTDTTPSICRDYQSKYPQKIKLLLQEKNKGLMANYADLMGNCRGEYIAQCAGDDYWIDEQKLQKQVVFFSQNPDFGFIRTGGYTLNEKGVLREIDHYNTATGDVFQYAKYGAIATACSICFKRSLLEFINFDEFIKRKFSMEDYPLHAILSKHTKFGYLPDLCVVYRKYGGALSRPLTKERKMEYYKGYVSVLLYLSELFSDEIDFGPAKAQNYILNKQLIFAFEEYNYREAKKIASSITSPTAKEMKLIRFSNNPILFYLGCLFKKLKK